MPKIVRFYKTGDAEVLKLDDLPLTEPGEGEVRLKVEAIGLKGRLVGEIMGGKVELWPKGGDPEDRSPSRTDAEIFGFPGSLESVRAFVECVRTGTRPEADTTVGERLCHLCNAARESFRAGGSRVPVKK